MSGKVCEVFEEAAVDLPTDRKSSGSRKPFEIVKLFITPLTIALVSAGVSWYIGKMQMDSAREIAEAQRETTSQIAENNLRRQVEVAAAETKLERLAQIKDVFREIIKPRKNQEDALAAEIASLVVYEDTALPFLLRIKEHFSTRPIEIGEALNTTFARRSTEREKLANVADKTIREILSLSQLDLSRMDFNSNGEGRALLRFAKFSGYNLTEADFSNTNLFNANFTKSTLVRAKFNNTDLQSADFTDANLTGAKFGSGTNLTKTNFEKTKIDGVKFDKDVLCIEEAKFSLGALLKIGDTPGGKKEPFADLDNEKYLRLLAPHSETISEMENDPKIDKIKKKLGISSVKSIVSELEIVDSANWKCRV